MDEDWGLAFMESAIRQRHKKESKAEVIARLQKRRDYLEEALAFAAKLIPKENIPAGVRYNVVPWLINKGKEISENGQESPPTEKQLALIKRMGKVLNIEFHGKTITEASVWIDQHQQDFDILKMLI